MLPKPRPARIAAGRRCRQCADARRGRARLAEEGGFSLIETTIALGLILAVLMGLLASLNTGVAGLLTGRHRTGGVALAKEIVEEVRSTRYEDVGHDLSDDDTLATDPALGGTAPNYEYQPEGVAAPETLVGVATPWRPEHTFPAPRDGTDYTVRFYITNVEQAVGKDHKRLTVAVSWDQAQYDPEVVENEVRVSTFVSPFGVSSGSEVSGAVDVDAGAVNVTGTLSGISLDQAEIIFPYAHADAAADLMTEARGFSGSSRSSLEVSAGTASGCGESGSEVTCSGTKIETEADSDGHGGTCLQDAAGPVSDSGGTLTAGSVFDVVLGSTSGVVSKSSAASGSSCAVVVGDGDGLLYGENDAPGAGSAAIGFAASFLDGNLVDIDSAGAANATLDSDAVSPDQKVSAQGRLTAPEIDLITLSPAPTGYTSAVNITGFDAAVGTEAGPTAAEPSVSGDQITVTYYDTDSFGFPTYRTVSFVPGDSLSRTGSVSFDVTLPPDVMTVTLDTTITVASPSISPPGGSPITAASAELTNWFVVTTRVQVVELGNTVADLTVDLDYGRIAATVEYTAP